MRRRRSAPRWFLLLVAASGTVLGTAAAAQPTEHGTPPASVPPVTRVPPTTLPPTTLPPTTEPPTTAPPTTVPDTTTTTTTSTTLLPPPPPTTDPPVQGSTTTTTTTTSTTVPTTTSTTVPGGGGAGGAGGPGRGGGETTSGGGAAPSPDAGSGSGVNATVDRPAPTSFDPPLPPPATAGPAGPAASEPPAQLALPRAAWTSAKGLRLVDPSAPAGADTRPLWLAALIGLAAGVSLTGTAAAVVGYLNRGRLVSA